MICSYRITVVYRNELNHVAHVWIITGRWNVINRIHTMMVLLDHYTTAMDVLGWIIESSHCAIMDGRLRVSMEGATVLVAVTHHAYCSATL